ncbi:cardiolipin synthase [Anaerobacillus sp. MEB173]|uniref:cardiolipin synthase n=1 Tax=Anaerobacillus sp. MEB173 TaxID=3383345 RepID=UPI003F9076C1
MTAWIVIFLIFLLIVWLRIDFALGKKKQKSEAKPRKQVTRYGEVQLFDHGHDLFVDMFQKIENANDHIHMLFYIINDDSIGQKLLDHLKAKAKQGVTVRLLVDRIGSKLSRATLQELKKAGVLFAYSHSPKFPYFFFTLNRRNHRKITVIDGKIGYIGGYNVGDEYLGRDPKFGPWRDFHLRIDGDGVQDLQEQFIEDWKIAWGEQLNSDGYYPPLAKGSIELKILPTDGSYLEDTFLRLVNQANKSITIGSPYFIPGDALHSELINAAKRGVYVKIIVPKKGDHPLVKEAAFPYFGPLLKSGCRIYRYYRGFYHSKVLIIDDHLCDVGTANFDKRSFHINHEINCVIFDKEFIELVRQETENDIAISEELTLEKLNSRSFFHRGKERFSTWVSGLL